MATASDVQLNDVRVERGEDGLVAMQIEVAPDTVREARQRVIKEYSRRIRVPGFRPGHIPANIVRRQIGDESISQAVSDELVPVAYQAALRQTELQPLDRAQVDELTFDAFDGDKPLVFTARVVVRPEIQLGDYSGLTATQPSAEVTEEDIERGLEELRAQRATMRDVEGRGAQLGDVVNGELKVYIGGELHGEGEPARLRAFVLGESGFVPSIDEHLLGANLDEERRFDVTYPSDFKDEELAGQAAEFAIKVTSLKERVLPELNDEFAKTLGLDDMAAVRERMRQAIQEGRQREASDSVRQQIAQAAVASAQFETPQSLVDTRFERRIQNLEHELSHREATLDDYLKSTDKTREEFDTEIRGEVEQEVRQELVLDEVAQREGITAEPEEIENHYRQVAAAMGQPIEEIVKRLDVETARASILQRKALDFLLERAVVTGEDGAPVAAAPVATLEEPVAVPEESVSTADEPVAAESSPEQSAAS
ncbi:MAG TPA: trigger factor [Abditibacteriaceae bacterium]|jgi:trigger factor